MTQYSDLTILSGGSREGARGVRPPLFSDQTEARRAEKNVGYRPPPPTSLSQGLDDRAPLFPEGLDSPLILAIR